MSQIVLLGNGFDLAHGLKTSYQDFIRQYVIDILSAGEFEDGNIQASTHASFSGKEQLEDSDFSSLKKFFYDEGHVNIHFKNRFLKHLFLQFSNCNWVDIESQYFKLLCTTTVSEAQKLNKDLKNVELLLATYLKRHIEPAIASLPPVFGKTFAKIEKEGRGEVIFVNFNYTSTLKRYYPHPNTKIKIIHIHGSLHEDNNDIVFGYGDDLSDEYQKIMDKGDNEYLKGMKTFKYLHADSYIQLMNKKRDHNYKLSIIGHGCGPSDSLLLQALTENRRCKAVDLYFHHGIEDFDDKVMNVSRYVSKDYRSRIRTLVTPFHKELMCPQAG